ncbi:hypothetical protein ACVCGT_25590 [Klebsiella pneumoniae]
MNSMFLARSPVDNFSPTASLDEPDSLKRLSKIISNLPSSGGNGVAAEINAHTGFADEFSMLVKPVPELMIYHQHQRRADG